MGNTFSYDHPSQYPECEKIHNSFKGPEDYFKSHANNVMIRNGDPEYINVIIKRYGFKEKNYNINAYAKDVLSGWDHWKFPIEPGKAKISVEILKTIDKLYIDYTKCKYALDFDYFNQKIKDKVEMDTEFIEICINILTDVEMFYMDTSLQKQIKDIELFLEKWENYSKHYHIYNREIYTKVLTLCNTKKIKISNLLKKCLEKNNINHQQNYYRPNNYDDDDEEERRRRDEDEEREREIEQEREDYEFYYGND